MENIKNKKDALDGIDELNNFIKKLDDEEFRELLMENRFVELINSELIFKLNLDKTGIYYGNKYFDKKK